MEVWLYCKLAGILCILAAGIWTGRELERGLYRRLLFVREMKETLDFLEKEMIYHRTPVPGALREAAARCSSGAQRVLRKAAEEAENRGGISFAQIWEAAVRDGTAGIGLTKRELEQTAALAGAFCNTDTVMQRTLIMKYRERFEGMSRELERICLEKGALYRKLSAAAGAFLALLLL